MRELYRQELEQLGAELERMSRGVHRAIERATRSLGDGDLVLAEQTINADVRLDETARGIDMMCVHLLALQGPVASDLRLILAALRLSQTMERQGDLARNLATIARSTYPTHNIAAVGAELVARMGQVAARSGELQHRLVVEQDTSLIAELQDNEELLDDLQADIRRLCMDESNDLSRQQVVDLTLAARFLERFGDHAVSVSRRVSYIVDGHRSDFTHHGALAPS